jgi:hypothetical protein
MNYFLEPGFAIAVLVGRSWTRLARRLDRSYEWRLLGCVALFFLCEPIFLSAGKMVFRQNHRLQYPAAILQVVRQSSGPVLIGDAGLAMRAEKPVLLLDKFNASYLADAGRIDCARVAKMLREGEVTVVISEVPLHAKIGNQSWWPKPLRRAITEFYCETAVIPGYWVFQPKGRGSQGLAARSEFTGPSATGAPDERRLEPGRKRGQP